MATQYSIAVSQPTIYNVTLYQYADLQITVTYLDSNGNPVNLAGYTLKWQFLPFGASQNVDWSTYVTQSNTAGQWILDLPGAQTAAYAGPIAGQMDLLITSGSGIETRLIQGLVYANPGVSH